MNNFKVFVNIILVKLKIRHVLPVEAIRKIKVKENNEKLTLIKDNELFLIKTELPYIRQTVADKLFEVAHELKKQNLKLVLFELLRDIEKQKHMWQEEYDKIKRENSNLPNDEIEFLVSKRVAKVSSNKGGGHQTGGAVDIGLCTINNELLDMGTEYLEFNDRTYTNSKDISIDQKNNRKLLLKIMKNKGFANFPTEWWHYSYGDTMWAAYSSKKEAIYSSDVKF